MGKSAISKRICKMMKLMRHKARYTSSLHRTGVSLLDVNKSTPGTDLNYLEVRQGSDGLVKNATLAQTYCGKLKIRINRTGQSLSVQVTEGEFEKKSGRFYVKLKLSRADGKTIKIYRTSRTESCQWNKLYSFRLKESHANCRLLISVFQHQKRSCSVHLGCMSFSVYRVFSDIKMLPEQNVVADGWYFLLHRTLGQSKHLRVVTERITFAEHDRRQTMTLPKTSSLEYTAELRPSEGSRYGLKLTGSSPAHVCRVVKDSIAQRAGIQLNDQILQINGTDVSTTNAATAATLIRHANTPIRISLRRVSAQYCSFNQSKDSVLHQNSSNLHNSCNVESIAVSSESFHSPIGTLSGNHTLSMLNTIPHPYSRIMLSYTEDEDDSMSKQPHCGSTMDETTVVASPRLHTPNNVRRYQYEQQYNSTTPLLNSAEHICTKSEERDASDDEHFESASACVKSVYSSNYESCIDEKIQYEVFLPPCQNIQNNLDHGNTTMMCRFV